MTNMNKVELWKKRMAMYNKKNNGVDLSLNVVEDASLLGQIKSISSITMRVFDPTVKDCKNQRYRCVNGSNMNSVFKKVKQIGVSSVNGVVFYTEVGGMKMVMKTPVSKSADDPEYEYHIHKILMNECAKWIPNIPLVYFGFTCSQSQAIGEIKQLKVANKKVPEKYKGNVPFCIDVSNIDNKDKFSKFGTFFIASQFVDNPQVLYEVSNKAKNFGNVIDIMTQATCALMVGQQRSKFSHYDLHQGNIMVSPMKNDSLFCYATYDKRMPYIFVDSPFLCYLIDFGRSYVNGKSMYFNPGHKDKNFNPFGPAITPNKFSPLYDVASVWMYPIISEAKDNPQNKYLQDFANFLESLFSGALDKNMYYSMKPQRTPGYRNPDGSRENIENAFDLLFALKRFGFINMYKKTTGKMLYVWNRDIKGEVGVIDDNTSDAIFDYEKSLESDDLVTMKLTMDFLDNEFAWMKQHKKPRTPTPIKRNTSASKIVKGMPKLNLNINYGLKILTQRASFMTRQDKCMKKNIKEIKMTKGYRDLPSNIGKSKMKKKELCTVLSRKDNIIPSKKSVSFGFMNKPVISSQRTIDISADMRSLGKTPSFDSQRTITDPPRKMRTISDMEKVMRRPPGMPSPPKGLRKSQKVKLILKALNKPKKVKRKLVRKSTPKPIAKPSKKSLKNVKKNCNKLSLKKIKKSKAYKDLPRKFGKSKRTKKELCKELMK